MAEGNGMTGFSILFTTGVAAGVAAGPSPIGAAAVSLLQILLLAALSLRRGPRFPAAGTGAALIFLTGLLAGLTSHFLPPPRPPAGPGAADALRRLIDTIPFPSPESGPLAKALLTGWRSDLDPDTVRLFRESGAAHMLALSGLHLGILYGILVRLTALPGNRPAVRHVRSGLILLLCGFYTGATGASPSLVRAFLFILIGETARALHRPQPAVHILCTALTLQLALQPGIIVSTGFQLSYLAMTGIALLYPTLRGFYPDEDPPGSLRSRLDLPRRIWEAAALTLSCQVFTAPLVWLRFGTFPPYFLLTNLFGLPVLSAAMILSVGILPLWAAGLCPEALVGLDDRMLQILLQILRTVAAL